MTKNELYSVVVSTPPENLPHKSRQEEIVELASYIQVQRTSPAGTNPIVQDSTKLGDNTEKIYVETSTTTPNMITAIKSYVSGVWTRWLIKMVDIDPDALDVMVDIEDDKLTIEHDETLPLREVDDDGKQALYAKPLVNGTNLAYTDDDEPVMEVPTNAQIDTPYVRNQLVFNPAGVFAGFPNCELHIGSNTGATSAEYEDGYSHGWIGSWNGIPIDIYISLNGTTSIFQFDHTEGLTQTQHGHTFKRKIDVNGNVLFTTAGGGNQNIQWTSDLGKSWFWGGSDGSFVVDKVVTKNLNVVDFPREATDLESGDVWWDVDNETLKVVT